MSKITLKKLANPPGENPGSLFVNFYVGTDNVAYIQLEDGSVHAITSSSGTLNLDFTQSSEPSAPPTAVVRLWLDTDNKLWARWHDGTEHQISYGTDGLRDGDEVRLRTADSLSSIYYP